MRKFELIQGGYKAPRKSQLTASKYLEAQLRLLQQLQNDGIYTISDIMNKHGELKKLIFLSIKSRIKSKEEISLENAEQLYSEYSSIFSLIGMVTIHELMQMFPISKTYDGDKYEVKDYFYTMDILKNKKLNEPIGDNAFEFLMEYENDDIRLLCVNFMMILGKLRILQGGRDPLEEFFSEQGVPSYRYYEKEGIMINQETKEVSKICKPTPRVPKYMKIIDGGLK